jgi:uncharacterized protein (TIGR02996 family)
VSEALLAQLVANPGDLEARRVYGDALSERGDPRGELIAIACTPAERRTPEVVAREAALSGQLRDELVARAAWQRTTWLDWQHGFVDELAFGIESGDPVDGLARLAVEPALRLVRRVAVSACEMDHRGDLHALVAEFARLAPAFPRLVDFEIYTSADLGSPWYSGPSDLGDVAPLIRAYPRLTRLGLGGDPVAYGDGSATLELPVLRELVATNVTADSARSLVELRTPPLDELELSFAQGAGIREVAIPLLAASAFAPRRLAVRRGGFLLDLLRRLTGAPLASRLDVLAIEGVVTADDLDAIGAWASTTPAVARVEIDVARLHRSTEQRARRALGTRLAQLPPRRGHPRL